MIPIQSSNHPTDKQGTFWVIDGLKVKRKQPFLVQDISRTLVYQPRQAPTYILTQDNTYSLQSKMFFIDKSHQIFEKKVDYGMLRASSLSSIRGGGLFSSNLEGTPFALWQIEQNKIEGKRMLFENKFISFNFPCQEQILNKNNSQYHEQNNMLS